MSREIPLTQGKVALVDDDIYEYLSRWKWRYLYPHKGITGYAVRWTQKDEHGNGPKKPVLMHRVILGVSGNTRVDHIDGDGLNNVRSNLREARQIHNTWNKAKWRRGTSSKFKGVCWHSRDLKWSAYIDAHGKRICLGYFDDEVEAAKAYDVAAVKYHGEYARLNLTGAES